jgi:FkbM family methyltransferase
MRFPALPHLGLQAADFDFSYARKFDMYEHLSTRLWTYEPDVLAVLLALLGQHRTSRFINVGANIGYFAVIAKKLFGDRVEVHAYEPMPKLAARLDKAQRKNRIRFSVCGSALADFEGTAPFHLSARSDTSNSLNPNFRPSRDVIDVPVATLDSEFPSPAPIAGSSSVGAGAEPATVLLIDTESTEPAVLRGGLRFIERVQPAIICEVLAGRTEDELSELVDRIGYASYALTDTGPVLRSEVVGDRTYQHRDWLFLPPAAQALDPSLVEATVVALIGPNA